MSSFIRLPRRRDLRQIVNLRFIYEFEDHKWQAFSRDLSMYGAFLKTDHVLPHDARVQLHFSIPGDLETVNCHAFVRRSAPVEHPDPASAGFAVEFDSMADHDAERLEAFIRRHLHRPLFR